ncbi:MAG: hypothetical protein HZB53_06930 [Chloroflexi bacterium]|nr:hypothetical protein [Chloroflexota bacterium]
MQHKRIHRFVMAILGVVVVMSLAACGAAATPAPTTAPATAPTAVPVVPTAVPPTAVPPTVAAVVPTAAATAAPTTPPPAPKAVTLQLMQNAQLGKFLADGDGHTLYMYTKDTLNVSNCYDKCAQAWPVVVPLGKPTVKEGVNEALVGATQRKDGTMQLTYNGWPIYYYAQDSTAEPTKGQAVGKVWWVVSGEGNIIKPSGLQVIKNDKLGQFLADEAGRTLYMYTKDTKDTSVCTDKCEQAWPPLLVLGQPAVQAGVTASLIGTTPRKDGTMQMTYKGMPLYYYAKDINPGDTTGQAVGTVWYVVAPDGSVMK